MGLCFVSHSIMRLKNTVISGVVVSALLATSPFVYADVNKGLEIAKERKQRDKGWQDSTASVEMLLKNAHGDTSDRLMRMKSLEVDNDGDKGLTIFDQPRDVKGTAFLTHSHVEGSDDQWLYLPALKRVKRISTRNKSGPFMGSEFAYEDLSSFEIAKYNYNYLKDEQVQGMDSFVVEQTPIDSKSGYTKQIVWLDKEHYRPLKVEYFDRKKSLLKTLTLSDYKLYLDKYWRALKLEMVNHQSGKSTILNTSEITFQNGLDDKEFNQNALKRIK